MTTRKTIIKEFREKYKEEYKNILPVEVLDKGNPWFEDFLHQSLLRFARSVMEEAIDNELNRWNSGGEYYDNVTKALTQLKSNVERILKDNEK